MNLKQKIDKDLKEAMLGRDEFAVSLLRSIKSVILDFEIKNGSREQGASDADIERLLMSEVKRRKESSAMYAENSREDLAENENREIVLINKYLPEQLDEVAVGAKIDEILADLSEAEAKNMGLVIGKVKAALGASADGALIAKIVKEKMNK